MSLNWNVQNVKNAYREVSKEEYEQESNHFMYLPSYEEEGKYFVMNVECCKLIWVCGAIIGIPTIDEDNYEIIFNRINLYEKIFGCFMYKTNIHNQKVEDYPFTLDMIKNHIGLKTNGVFMSKIEWVKCVTDRIMDDSKVY